MKGVRTKINAVDRVTPTQDDLTDLVTSLRIRLLTSRIAMLRDILQQDRDATGEITKLVDQAGTSLCDVVGIAPASCRRTPCRDRRHRPIYRSRLRSPQRHSTDSSQSGVISTAQRASEPSDLG